MEIKQLIDDYIHWLKKEITFEKIEEYYEITTPFLNSANDFIQIYVRIDKDTIFFTDDKNTYTEKIGYTFFFHSINKTQGVPNKRKEDKS